MKVALFCATHRGYRFLSRLGELAPLCDLVVFSFREEPWEPPFLDDIRQLAIASEAEFHEAKRFDTNAWRSYWQSSLADLILLVNWRYLLPEHVYRRPRLGCFTFHDSLLPEYRGFSPTVWAIANGEDHTGVTLIETSEEVDAGDIIDQKRIPIGPDETIDSVTERVTEAYLELLERNLGNLLSGTVPRHVQDHTRATYTPKRVPEDNQIDWSRSSEEINNLIRAVSEPYPGAFTCLAGRQIRIWSAKRISESRRYVGRAPGRVVEVRKGEGAVVLTGDGILLVSRIQLENAPVATADCVLDSITQTLGR